MQDRIVQHMDDEVLMVMDVMVVDPTVLDWATLSGVCHEIAIEPDIFDVGNGVVDQVSAAKMTDSSVQL